MILLGEKICIYRGCRAEVIALDDAYMHRKFPLSKGRLKDD
jgi:phenylpropionate dioxygenase-like ring-hydroxylating dioxygenase large terminal subunit